MADLLQSARDLGPSLADRSELIEATRTLPDDVVHDLRAAGLFRLLTPASLGGPELDVNTAIDVIAEVSRHDGAAGWCVMIAGTTSLQAGFLSEHFASEIFGPANSCVGGFAAPVGAAHAADAACPSGCPPHGG